MRSGTPWSAMLAAARGLGVTPSGFWRLSLREWRAIASPSNVTLSRASFEALASRFPDNQHE